MFYLESVPSEISEAIAEITFCPDGTRAPDE